MEAKYQDRICYWCGDNAFSVNPLATQCDACVEEMKRSISFLMKEGFSKEEACDILMCPVPTDEEVESWKD